MDILYVLYGDGLGGHHHCAVPHDWKSTRYVVVRKMYCV